MWQFWVVGLTHDRREFHDDWTDEEVEADKSTMLILIDSPTLVVCISPNQRTLFIYQKEIP